MSDQPETLDKIIAEMHDFCSGWSEDVDVTVKVGLIYGWECRLDAAAERERNAHTNDIHNALYMATGIPGNAAAMRAALERIVNIAPEYPARGVDWNALAAEAFLTASSGLSAPARNCDRFATEDEAREAYWAYREPLEFNNKPFVAITEWLFAPAEGGDHA